MSLATAKSGAAIRYTMDGSTPTETSGTLYTGTPIPVGSSMKSKPLLTRVG